MNNETKNNFKNLLKETLSFYPKDTDVTTHLSRLDWYFTSIFIKMNKLMDNFYSIKRERVVKNPFEMEKKDFLDKISLKELIKRDETYRQLQKIIYDDSIEINNSYNFDENFKEILKTLNSLKNLHKDNEDYIESLWAILEIFEEELSRLYFAIFEATLDASNNSLMTFNLQQVIGSYFFNKDYHLDRYIKLLNGGDEDFLIIAVDEFDSKFDFEQLIDNYYFDYFYDE